MSVGRLASVLLVIGTHLVSCAAALDELDQAPAAPVPAVPPPDDDLEMGA